MESYTGDIKLRYYRRIEEIWELDYSREKVSMFFVRWAKIVVRVERGFATMCILETKSKTARANVTVQNEPWVLAKHVEPCFFIIDPSRPSCIFMRRSKMTIVGMDRVDN
jgi:hypothetical protein